MRLSQRFQIAVEFLAIAFGIAAVERSDLPMPQIDQVAHRLEGAESFVDTHHVDADGFARQHHDDRKLRPAQIDQVTIVAMRPRRVDQQSIDLP